MGHPEEEIIVELKDVQARARVQDRCRRLGISEPHSISGG